MKEQDQLLTRAIIFAAKAHEGQTRKGTDIPYIVHPMEVASIVATMTSDEEIIAAAVLHDVIEDTEESKASVQQEFGERVANLVASESENKREELPAEDTWKVRKQETIDHLKNLNQDEDSTAIKQIALGDKLSNMRSIARDYDTIGSDLWKRFNQSNPAEIGWYYRGMCEAVADAVEGTAAYQEYVSLLDKVF